MHIELALGHNLIAAALLGGDQFLDRLPGLGVGLDKGIFWAGIGGCARIGGLGPRVARPGTAGATVSGSVRSGKPRSRPAPGNTCSCKEGGQGPQCADFAALRVVASRRAPPGPDLWLLLRRHPQTTQLKTYLIQGPPQMTRAQLVWLAAMRRPIDTCFHEGRQLLGLGDYEGRSWTGWHHHMTLCLLAHFFLVRQKLRLKKRSPCSDRAPNVPAPGCHPAPSSLADRPHLANPGLSGGP